MNARNTSIHGVVYERDVGTDFSDGTRVSDGSGFVSKMVHVRNRKKREDVGLR